MSRAVAVAVVLAMALATANAQIQVPDRTLWNIEFPSNVADEFVFHPNGNFIVPTHDALFAVSRDGSIVWESPAPPDNRFYGCDVRGDGDIFCGTDEGVVIFNADGDPVGSIGIPARVKDVSVYSDAAILITQLDSHLYATIHVNLATMTIDDFVPVGDVYSFFTKSDDGRNAAYSYDNGVIFLYEDGQLVCDFQTDDAFGPNLYGYVTTVLGVNLYILVTYPGNLLVIPFNSCGDYNLIDTGVPLGHFPVIDNDIIYFGGYDGVVTGVDVFTGIPVFQVNTPFTNIQTDLIVAHTQGGQNLLIFGGYGRLAFLDIDTEVLDFVWVGNYGLLNHLQYEECTGFIYGSGLKKNFFAINIERSPLLLFTYDCSEYARFSDFTALTKKQRRAFRNAFLDNIEALGTERPRNGAFQFVDADSFTIRLNDYQVNAIAFSGTLANLKTKRCKLASIQGMDIQVPIPQCGCYDNAVAVHLTAKSFWKTFAERDSSELSRFPSRLAQALIDSCDHFYECDVVARDIAVDMGNPEAVFVYFRDIGVANAAIECMSSQYFRVDRTTIKGAEVAEQFRGRGRGHRITSSTIDVAVLC